MLKRLEDDKVKFEKVSSEISNLLSFDWQKDTHILVTGHRRENFGQGFREICEAIRIVAEQRKDICFVYPVHLNPKVLVPVSSILGELDNVHLIEPMEYAGFVLLMKVLQVRSHRQWGHTRRSSSLGKPVLVMRNVTERNEAVGGGDSITCWY